MKELRTLKEYINNSLGELEAYHERRFGTEMLVRHETKMKSILVFTYLYDEFYDDEIPEVLYKELINDGIGLIGPGDGCLTALLHKLFGLHKLSGLMEYYMMLMANFTTDMERVKVICIQFLHQKHIIG